MRWTLVLGLKAGTLIKESNNKINKSTSLKQSLFGKPVLSSPASVGPPVRVSRVSLQVGAEVLVIRLCIDVALPGRSHL